MPNRIQRKRMPGWRMPEGAVYVGRPSVFGNPLTERNAIEVGYLRSDDPAFVMREFLTRCFRDWLTGDAMRGGRDWWEGPESDQRRAAIMARITELRGRDLACWCPLNHDCHADILLELANCPVNFY